ncbi:MAG TPA: glycosyltransferase [Silvibacterium sp.]|nr:glycosyltransferase [Silvibacterium sp.]
MHRIANRIFRYSRQISGLLDFARRPGPADRIAPSYPFGPLPKNLIHALQDEISKGVDVCQAEFSEMLSLGAWFPKQIPKLFIHHQLHFVYSQRFLDVTGGTIYSDYLDSKWRVHEIAHLRNFDGVVTFSEHDRSILLPWLAPEKVFVSPFPVPADTGIAVEIPVRFNGQFILLASEVHPPNRDALAWLIDAIWPEIFRALPSARLNVIGKWSKSSMAKYNAPGVSFSGYIPDLAESLRGGIMLAPLRIGSGIRVKILSAMAQGVPVVSTSIGSEGLFVTDSDDILVRDDASEFAEAAVAIARDHHLWARLAKAGVASITRNYSPEMVRQRRNHIYAALSLAKQSSRTADQGATPLSAR